MSGKLGYVSTFKSGFVVSYPKSKKVPNPFLGPKFHVKAISTIDPKPECTVCHLPQSCSAGQFVSLRCGSGSDNADRYI